MLASSLWVEYHLLTKSGTPWNGKAFLIYEPLTTKKKGYVKRES